MESMERESEQDRRLSQMKVRPQKMLDPPEEVVRRKGVDLQQRKWAWSEVQMEQLAVAACVRLHPQNMEDESRGTTQTCTARSNERSLRSSRSHLVKVREFSSQIPLSQTTGRDEPQCRGTIGNLTKAFSNLSLFWETVCFSLSSTYHTIIKLYSCIVQLLQCQSLHAWTSTTCVLYMYTKVDTVTWLL